MTLRQRLALAWALVRGRVDHVTTLTDEDSRRMQREVDAHHGISAREAAEGTAYWFVEPFATVWVPIAFPGPRPVDPAVWNIAPLVPHLGKRIVVLRW